MPVVPHYPSDEPEKEDNAPNVDELIEDILGGDDSGPTVPLTTTSRRAPS
ncbi:MAG: hypothetical protein SVG88_10105 [Halobacteriales archaeon]|nr:hypothetical protein [Halobacteriales archaeon]